jgi:hypothetical protein
LEKKTAAAKALNAAKLQVEEAEEERDKAIEKTFEFYGSNLSQSKQSSWEKIVTKLTIDAPHSWRQDQTDILRLRADAFAVPVCLQCCGVAEVLRCLWS